MTKPMLSIVIANYNYGRFLEDAIKSVIAQDVGDKVELIICDAGSTDGSVEIIKKYACGLPANTKRLDWSDKVKRHASSSYLISWWCSEKDGGQSAAFNKGFSHAHGNWLTWLNADDILLPGTLKAFEALVKRHPKAGWVTGNKIHFNTDTLEILQVFWGPHRCFHFGDGQRTISAVFGPTAFIKREVYDKVGPIDERLHYVMDSAYWAKFTMCGIKQTRLNHLCWGCRVHDESKTWGAHTANISKRRKEETELWRKEIQYYYATSPKNPWYVLWLVIRVLDGSLFARYFLKRRFEGKNLSSLTNI